MGEEGSKFQATNYGLVFLVTSPPPKVVWIIIQMTMSPPTITSLEQESPITPEIPKDLGTQCQELRSKTKY